MSLERLLKHVRKNPDSRYPAPGFLSEMDMDGVNETFAMQAWKLFKLRQEAITVDDVRKFIKNQKLRDGEESQEDEPDEYQPIAMRPVVPKVREQVIYACGYTGETSELSFRMSLGMWAGPTPILLEMLEQVPEEENLHPVVVRFNKDGTDEVLYKWSRKRKLWKKETKGD